MKKQQQQQRGSEDALVGIVIIGFFVALAAYMFSGESGTSSNQPPPPPSTPPAREWYEGGTLHKKTMAEWRSASYEDRLATAADFCSGTADKRGVSYRSMDEVKADAINLERAITVAGEGGDSDSLAVAEVAAACQLLMMEKQRRRR